MIDSECESCGGRIAVLARSCPHCGAANRMRVAGVAIAGALAALLAAIAVAAVVVIGGHRLPATVAADPTAGLRGATGPDADMGWLTTAMDACQTEAEQDTGTLHFLVIPLATSPQDEAQWRGKSLNDIGNAILLGTDDAVAGLKEGTLRIFAGQYDFRVLDQATETVYKWNVSSGVTNFSTEDAGAIALFRVQFLTVKNRTNVEWGTSFVRQSGTCYWVSAVVGQ